jgi:hypothetical protein
VGVVQQLALQHRPVARPRHEREQNARRLDLVEFRSLGAP